MINNNPIQNVDHLMGYYSPEEQDMVQQLTQDYNQMHAGNLSIEIMVRMTRNLNTFNWRSLQIQQIIADEAKVIAELAKHIG